MSIDQCDSVLSDIAQSIYGAISCCTDPEQLENLNRRIWIEAHANGWIGDAEATYLISCIDRRRPKSLGSHSISSVRIGQLAGRLHRRFTPRKPQRSPDRKASRDRRRMLGGSSCMPPKLSLEYTEGERPSCA